jgi:hypothetical protein
MPIKSQKQWKYLAIHHPDLLHEWQQEAPRKFSKLPARSKKKSRKK